MKQLLAGFSILEVLISVGLILLLTLMLLPTLERYGDDGTDAKEVSTTMVETLRDLAVQASTGANQQALVDPLIPTAFWLEITDSQTYQTGYTTADDQSIITQTVQWPGIQLGLVNCRLTYPLNSTTVIASNCEERTDPNDHIIITVQTSDGSQVRHIAVEPGSPYPVDYQVL